MKRATGLLVYEVKGANPNGSPDWDNQPRTLNDGRGVITPVSVKRKIRDLLADHNSDVFKAICQELDLNPDEFHIFESMHRGFDLDDAVKAARDAIKLSKDDSSAFLKRYWDVRVFGTTLLEENKDKDKENAKYIKTGCVSFSPAFSIAPVQIVEMSITKKAPLREELLVNKQGDMAPMALKFVQHGLYCQRFGVNPHVAHYTNTTDKDIEVLKALLKHTFNFSESASRPAGSMNLLHAWWAEHEKPLGSFKESDFFAQLTPTKESDPENPSTKLTDYNIPNKAELGVDVVDLA